MCLWAIHEPNNTDKKGEYREDEAEKNIPRDEGDYSSSTVYLHILVQQVPFVSIEDQVLLFLILWRKCASEYGRYLLLSGDEVWVA